MDLATVGEHILLNSEKVFKNRKFNILKFEPSNLYKPIDNIDVAYSTINNFKECKLKFFIKKIFDINFFKQSEALFSGNLVHKYVEEIINAFSSGQFVIKDYNDFVKSLYINFQKRFEKSEYNSINDFVEHIYKYTMGRKKFEPDLFFDDLSFISSIYSRSMNYVEINKKLFQNAAKLVKMLLGIVSSVNARDFNCEKWFKFKLNDLPLTFTGKIDLYFYYDQNGKEKICLIDFKTGKKEYFSWDQLNYYALYFEKDMFSNVEKYFFDIKECNKYKYNDIIEYDMVFNHLYNICTEINDVKELYSNARLKLQEKYSDKLDKILNNSTVIESIPFDIVSVMFAVIVDFFKKSKIKDFHSEGGFVCNYCDMVGYCNIR